MRRTGPVWETRYLSRPGLLRARRSLCRVVCMTNTDKLYPDLNPDDKVRVACGKCDGQGSISWGAQVTGAIHLVNGGVRLVPQVCFKCNGLGYHMRTVKSLRAAARREARAAARWAAEADARAEREAAAARAEEERKARIAAERAARDADAADCPEGRVTITGEVVSVKRQENQFGTTTKMLVRDDSGFKVWGTMAAPLADALYQRWYEGKQNELGDDFHTYNYGPDVWFEVARGSRVTFTATVKKSDDDRIFGFFNRPTKAEVID